MGEGGSSGGASPDIVRLYGKRLLRVKELPEGEPLRENLVKELTGAKALRRVTSSLATWTLNEVHSHDVR